jgi:glycosyltransferase involved in cell wall biosynthesis
MPRKKFLIFIVTFNAEKTLAKVIDRLPDALFADQRIDTHILVIDDCSQDQTFRAGYDVSEGFNKCPLTILKNPKNLGYGGNQKLGYRFALDHGFDFVALLHGDGQYAPEELPRLIEPLITDEADAVFGSRMIRGRDALKGGMPLYKFVANRFLTRLQNLLVGTDLSEYHSGYRIYSCRALRQIPFERNADYFDFDTDIIIQLHALDANICEIPIPTFYGDEVCHVNGFRYAARILASSVRYRIQGLGIFYEAKFDVKKDNEQYVSKFDFLSSHSLAVENVKKSDSVLIMGSGPLPLVEPFLTRAQSVCILDTWISPELASACDIAIKADLDYFDFEEIRDESFTKVFALDVIEHLKSPEKFLERIRYSASTRESVVYITTPNIAFVLIRLMLILGKFNYGKRGILDLTHTRLFTFQSLKKLLEQAGYDVLGVRGIPVPFPLAVGRNFLGRSLLKLNEWMIKVMPSFFSYQIFVECRPRLTVSALLEKAETNTTEELTKIRSERTNAPAPLA